MASSVASCANIRQFGRRSGITGITVHISIVRFEVIKAEEVDVQDIVDAVRTLKPPSKIVIEIPYPGKGPDHFLQWAKEELAEAQVATIPSHAARKAFNVSILSECAFECLVDWYISKHLLNLTIRQFAGLSEKLQALNAEARLGIGLSLFQNTIFDPRNNAVHKYELVDLVEARQSYQLANLTIHNCKNTEAPHLAPIFYGHLEVYTGEEALQRSGYKQSFYGPPVTETAFYFAGIGEAGKCAVFIDRDSRNSRICIFTSLANGDVESRFSLVTKFNSEQLGGVFDVLETSRPTPIELSKDELIAVLQAFTGRSHRPKGISF
jgi:hypothetical protein